MIRQKSWACLILHLLSPPVSPIEMFPLLVILPDWLKKRSVMRRLKNQLLLKNIVLKPKKDERKKLVPLIIYSIPIPPPHLVCWEVKLVILKVLAIVLLVNLPTIDKMR